MWMYTLLPKLLNMSLTAAIVIVPVLLIRLPLKKAPKILSYALWAVVLFRLVCPVSVSSQLSLMGLFPTPVSEEGDGAYSSINYIPENIVHTEFPQVNLPRPGLSEAINSTLPQGGEQLAADPLEAPMAAATLLWLAGVAAMLAYSVSSFLRLRRKLVGAVRLRDNIYLADHIAAPFVLGLFRPKIYLPSTLREEEQSYVILHEETHIRRFDHVFKLLAFLALAVHWFNPLVWLAFVCCVKDMEMSCDEHVIKQMGGDIRGAYASSLLALSAGRRLARGYALAFGEGDIKGRIRNIMNLKRPAFWVLAAAVAVVVVAGIVLAANPTPADAPAAAANGTSQYVLAFVDDTLSETEARALESSIERLPNVESAVFETREEAMRKFEAKFEDESLFESIDASVLRHRYYITLRDVSLAEQTAKEISRIAGIAKVNAAAI